MTAPKLPSSPQNETYVGQLLAEKDDKKLTEYEAYLKKHNRELRRLQREARGEQVPGGYDGGYDE